MSRMPVNSEVEQIDIRYVDLIENDSFLSNNEILEATQRDMLLNNVKRYIRNKWPFKLSDNKRRYFNVKDELWIKEE
ncbi:hypothetical protein A3Q56_06630, partial [Intoshia linei]